MSRMTKSFDDFRECFSKEVSVVVTGHRDADGDAFGAIAALRRHFELEDVEVLALLSEPLSRRYTFMTAASKYEVYDPDRHDVLIQKAGVVVVCDLSSLSRLGRMQAVVEASSGTLVCIDHHPCEGGGPGKVNLLDEKATATGRIVWDYIHHVEGAIDREIAEAVFVSLCTDTGWFRYSNTDVDVLQLASELAEHRLDLPAIYDSIYQANPLATLRLLGHVVRTMTDECEGSFVWAQIHRHLMDDLGVEDFEPDPILDVMRSGESVEVVALFVEIDGGRVKGSLRSQGAVDVNQIAREFGGGGHSYAAGVVFEEGTAEEGVRGVVSQLRKKIRGGP